MVEFAVVVPLFLLLLFGLIDFSRLLFTYVSLSNGAREMARVASISNGWSSDAAINAFNNTTIVAGRQDGTGNQVTILVGNASCAKTRDTGGTCSPAPTSVVCALPLQTTNCTLPTPSQGGFVEVQVNYTFQFNPLFQTRIENVIDVSFMRPTAAVSTTARGYVE
jgi:Flp pilus assembly protein TadG